MVDKKKKKPKRKTKKRLSREMIKIVVNNYLNNRDLRKQRRRQAQQKRNPQQRLGGAYPLQNKAIDSISYSNNFRGTNDIRLMALERGMSNALTANISMLNDVVRHNKNLPLLDNKPHLPDPSQDYKSYNPNYPDEDTQSTISGFSVDADELESLRKDFDIDDEPRPAPPPKLTNIPEEKTDVSDPLTKAVSDELEKEKEKKGGGKTFKAPEGLLEETEKETKKIKLRKKPDKDYGPRPTQQAIFSAMPESQVIDKAKFYGLPESEIAKYTNKNRDGDLTITTGKLKAFKVAILNRAREVTKPSARGRPFGS
tara:strand:- start:29 stop:964 length:936 start_codon:yes stop_codon:yes gene_type:complete